MSHWEKVKTEITDLAMLESACKELGYETERNGVARGWTRTQGSSYGSDMTCPLVIKMKGRYDIAVVETDEGSFAMQGDFYDGSIQNACSRNGDRLGKISEMYAVHTSEALCRRQRIPWKREVQEDGINLVLEVN